MLTKIFSAKTVMATVAALALSVGFGGAAEANAPREIGTYGKWSAFVYTENGKKVCYMASRPTKDEGNYTRRGDIYAMVIHRPAENSRNEVIFISGYPHRRDSSVRVAIGGENFTLTTDKDLSFTRNAGVERSLVTAIRRGSNMIVRGTSSRGTATKDTYSLSGSSKAYDTITRQCR
ncbi:MAG: invasion associated locus B family protein [Alphaproteobacteria bacterium]